MANEWYYTKNGERKGPVSTDGLRLLAQTGQLGPNDSVWKNGMAQWVPAKTIKGLFSATTPPEPTAVPTQPPVPAKSAATLGVDEKLPEKAQRFISGLKDRWSELSTKTKAIAVGAVALVGVSLFGCVLCSGWMLFGGKTESPKLAANPTGKRNQQLDDVIGKRNKNLDDVTGKRNQKLDDVIAKRNKKLGETSPPSSDTDNGGSDDQANRDRIEAKLQGMNLNALTGKYGNPDSIWMNPKRSNVKLYIWHLGGSSTDMYIVQLVIHAIDGRSTDIQENAKVLTSSQLNRLKQNLEAK